MMIDPFVFYKALIDNEIVFFTGVPDSLLKEFCSVISANVKPSNHVVASNEGAAVGIAIGNYAATGKIPLVYMQNSGIGNAINPLISLADPKVMAIPILLMVGWRGELDASGRQVKDEPQHAKQGHITPELLDALDLPYEIIDGQSDPLVVSRLKKLAIARSGPVALVVRRGAFQALGLQGFDNHGVTLSRETALETVISAVKTSAAIVSTTGMLSRELFELRVRRDDPLKDLFVVGGMGHAISIATGIACAQTQRQVICLDGDGAALMHLGALSISCKMHNLIHVVFNNRSHDSVGGQDTCAPNLSLSKVARSLGYTNVSTATCSNEIEAALTIAQNRSGSQFIEIICKKGSREGLGRPTGTPKQNLEYFRSFLQD